MDTTEMPSTSKLFDLTGRVAIVVGASGYLGSEFARTLASLGASVVACSRNEESCSSLVKELETAFDGQQHLSLACDVTSRESIQGVKAIISKHYGGSLHVLINSVWAGHKVTWEECSEEEWLTDIDASLSGTFRTIQAFAPMMGSGTSIINIASMYGHVAPDYRLYDGNQHVNPPSYSAAKGGVLQLTRYFASFLAPKGIRVNAISPGPFPFERVQDEEHFTARLKSKTMLGRVGTPSDLRGVIALLASDASSYITGQSIAVDGGWTAW